jgi:hypothetical protein
VSLLSVVDPRFQPVGSLSNSSLVNIWCLSSNSLLFLKNLISSFALSLALYLHNLSLKAYSIIATSTDLKADINPFCFLLKFHFDAVVYVVPQPLLIRGSNYGHFSNYPSYTSNNIRIKKSIDRHFDKAEKDGNFLYFSISKNLHQLV